MPPDGRVRPPWLMGSAAPQAEVFLFLACERLSSFITGQTIGVNGGMHLI